MSLKENDTYFERLMEIAQEQQQEQITEEEKEMARRDHADMPEPEEVEDYA